MKTQIEIFFSIDCGFGKKENSSKHETTIWKIKVKI